MDYQVILGDLFLADLQEIIDYLAKHADNETAQKVGLELLNLADEAGHHPFAGTPVPKRPGTRKLVLY